MLYIGNSWCIYLFVTYINTPDTLLPQNNNVILWHHFKRSLETWQGDLFSENFLSLFKWKKLCVHSRPNWSSKIKCCNLFSIIYRCRYNWSVIYICPCNKEIKIFTLLWYSTKKNAHAHESQDISFRRDPRVYSLLQRKTYRSSWLINWKHTEYIRYET